MRIAFSVPGEPKGKARARAHARIVWKDGAPKAVVAMHTPPETVAAEKAVLDAFRSAFPRHEPFTGPVLLKFVAVFGVPPSWPKRLRDAAASGTLYCVKKPDKDNIEKLVVDALTPPKRRPGQALPPSTAGFAWVDDQQVMGGGIKRYGFPPRIEVFIESLEQPDVPATPGQQRLEGRVAAGGGVTRARPLLPSSTKSKSRAGGGKLQAAVAAALARDAAGRPRK